VDPQTLQQQFGAPGVRFEAGAGGLTQMLVETDACKARLFTHGAHLAAWRPASHEPVLFMSRRSWFEPGKPIRGGVPICWPWFGPAEDRPDAPAHGFARIMDWQIESVRAGDEGATVVTLGLCSDDATAGWLDGRFELRYTLTLGATLEMTLQTRNTGDGPFSFSEALHTYFAVADVRHVRVTGLENTTYLSKVAGGRSTQPDEPIRFAGETDRVYLNTAGPCTLHDPSMDRRIVVEKTGSQATVVWNPWVAKAAAMLDFGDDEWPAMVCIETANAVDHVVSIAPGDSHTMAAHIRVE